MRTRNIYSANLAICQGDSAIHYWQNHGVGPWASSLEYQVLCRSFVNISGFLWFVDMSDWNQLRESWKDTVYILPCQTFQQSRCFPLFFNISENSRHIDPLQKIMFFWLGIWQWHCHVLTHSKPPNWICEAKKNTTLPWHLCGTTMTRGTPGLSLTGEDMIFWSRYTPLRMLVYIHIDMYFDICFIYCMHFYSLYIYTVCIAICWSCQSWYAISIFKIILLWVLSAKVYVHTRDRVHTHTISRCVVGDRYLYRGTCSCTQESFRSMESIESTGGFVKATVKSDLCRPLHPINHCLIRSVCGRSCYPEGCVQ